MAALVSIASMAVLCALSLLPSIDWRGLYRARRAKQTKPNCPEGALRTVWGRIVAIRTTLSPIDGVRGVASWTALVGRSRRWGRARVEHGEALDFFLDSVEGRFLVRVAGFRLDEPCPAQMPLRVLPEGDLAKAVSSSDLDLGASTLYGQTVLQAGDTVAVTGVFTVEAASEAALSVQSYRDLALQPTLRAHEGRLDILRWSQPEVAFSFPTPRKD